MILWSHKRCFHKHERIWSQGKKQKKEKNTKIANPAPCVFENYKSKQNK